MLGVEVGFRSSLKVEDGDRQMFIDGKDSKRVCLRVFMWL